MIPKAVLQQENSEFRQRIAELEKELAACKNEKNKDRFPSLFEHTPVAYQSLDEQGNFLDINPFYCELTGYSEEELLGRNFGDLWTSATCSLFAQAFDTLKRENYIQTDLQLVCKDGSIREVVLNGSVQRDEQGQFIRTHCILHDVTERKRAENAIRESEERFATLFRANPTAIGITRQPDLKIMEVNDAWCQLTGHTSEQAIEHTSSELGLVTPETLHKVREELRAHGKIRDFEISLITHSGEECHVLMSAEPIHLRGEACVLSSLLDITERKQAEADLHESEERHRLISELISDYVYILRVEPGNQFVPEWISGSFERFSGYSIAEVQAMGGPLALIPPENKAVSLADSARILQGETVITEVQMVSKNGETRWVRSYSRPIWDEGHTRITRIIGAGQDITERKLMEKKLVESEQFLKESQRIANMGSWRLDPATFKAGWSENCYKLYGFEPYEIEPSFEFFKQTVHPDDLQLVEESINDLLQNPRPVNHELRIFDRNGRMKWLYNSLSPVVENGQVVELVGTQIDITERKQSEEKLRASEEKWRSLFEILPIGISIVSPGNDVVESNPALTKILNYSTEELATGEYRARRYFRADNSLMPAEEFPSLRALQEGKLIRDVEIGIEKEDGERIWTSVSAAPFSDRGGTVTITADITERRQVEQSLKQQTENLQVLHEASQRLSSTLDLDTIYELVNDFMGEIAPNDGIMISSFDPQSRMITCRAYKLDQEWQNVDGFPPIPLEEEGRGTQSRVIRTGRPMLLNDYRAYEKTASTRYIYDSETGEIASTTEGAREEEEQQGLPGSALLVPLITGGVVTGVLQLFSDRRDAYTEDQLKLLEALAVHISSAEQNARLYAQAQAELDERKRTEEKLRESEEKYRGLMESLDSVVAAIDGDGKFLYMNEIAARQLGGTPQALIGKTAHELFPEPVATQHLKNIRQVIQADKGLVEENVSFVQGKARWYRTSLQPIHDKNGRVAYVLLHATDIHELKSTQQELAELNRTLEERIQKATAEIQDLYDNAPTGYHSLDANANFIMVNQTELNWLGYTREEVIGHPIGEFVTPDSLSTFQNDFQIFKQRGWLRDLELEFLRKDGTIFQALVNATAIYDKDGSYVMSRSTVFDISRRKRAEEALRENLKHVNALHTISQEAISTTDLKSLLSLVADTLVEALSADRVNILFMDMPNRKIEFACRSGPGSSNIADISFEEAWEGLSGWALREQEIAWSPGNAPDDRESPAVQERRKATGAGDIIVVPIIYQDHPLGTITVINKREDRPFRPEDLNLAQAIANQSAVAIERVRAGNDLRQVNLALEHALRAKDDFLANMSHELRTPLNGILGMAEILLSEYRGSLNERQHTYVTTIEASGRHLLSLINDVLDLSKIEADKMELHLEAVSADDLCQASLAFIKEAAVEKHIQVELIKDETVTSIQADARRLKQVLVNLLSNAVKFTPAEGRVKLEVRADRAKGRIDLSVVDTGIGISAEEQQRIFSPFVQADNSLTRSYEGTGLGLTLVKRLTELHGGSVSVESEPGKGSRFTVSLPWQEPESAPQSPLETEAPSAEKSGALVDRKSIATILLVEDNPTNVMVIGEYLDSKGYSMVYAADGYEGLEKAAECSPNLILMDIQMPGMDGLETTRRLRTDPQFAATPIIALTAHAMKGDRERCLEAGATDYLSKPVKLAELAALIRQLLM